MNLRSEGNTSNTTDNSSVAKRPVEGVCNAIQRHDPPALSLDDHGVIQDCSKSFETLFGFLRSDLVRQHVSTLFPQLSGVELMRAGQFNPQLNYLCRCGHLFHVQNRKGDILAINLNFVHIGYAGNRFLKLFVRPPCGGNA